MWAACTALLAALACVAISVQRYRALLALEDGVAFCDRLGHGSLERLRILRGKVVAGYALELVSAVLDARDLRGAVFGLNEVGSELKYALTGAHELPRSAARISLGLGAVLAVLQLIDWLRGTPSGLGFALVCLVAGLSAGLVCSAVAHRSAIQARTQLAAWTRAIRILGAAAEARFGQPTGRGAHRPKLR